MKRLILLLLLLFLASCNNDDKIVKSRESEYLTDFTINTTRKGHKEWTLLAEKAIQSPGDSMIVIFNFNLTFFKQDSFDSYLKADSGLFYPDRGDLYAYKNVFVLTKDSVELRTDSLFWNNSEKVLHAPGEILLKQSGMLLKGKDLTSRSDLKEIVIKNVEGREKI
ncbi:LPS export ABC transporter periplasmic protein LptC [candidate division WOR-3 bacterium]|nr:LPS export ABC transporter periplasmic protein LptC [candidate division WOR-3 bacterium]